jgi:hypothetical protein
MQGGFRTVATGPYTGAPLDGEGCASLATGESVALRIVQRKPIGLDGSNGALVDVVWTDAYGRGVRTVSVGNGRRTMWLADPGEEGAVLDMTVTRGSLQVCGLRAG